MAIQVNGTEVISNSRALNNIASADATTVATLNSAGVGGSVTLTADGAITAGDPLNVTSAGKAEVLNASVIGPVNTSHGNTQSVASAGNGSGQYVLLELVDSVGLRATVFSDTTGALVAGTVTTIVSGATTSRSVEIMYHPNSGKYIIGYCNGDDAEARVLSVSGTTPSVGSATKIVGDNGGEFTIKYAYSTSDYKVGCIVSSGYFSETSYYVSCCVGTVSGTSISFGSKSSLETAYSTCEGDIAYSPDDNKFALLWRANSGAAQLRIGTISGTSFSLGSQYNTGENTRQAPMNLEYSTSEGRFFYNFMDNDNVKTGSFDISGTSISGHNVSTTFIDTGHGSDPYSAAYMTMDATGTPYTIAAKRIDPTPYDWVADFYPLSFSSTTQVGSSILQLSYSSTSSFIYSRDRTFNFDSAGKTFVGMYSAPSSVEIINYTVNPSNVGKPFVGFADNTVSDGGSVSINLAGKVATGVGTGLTPGQEYFMDGGASPTLSEAGYDPKSIGVAVSSTDILMT